MASPALRGGDFRQKSRKSPKILKKILDVLKMIKKYRKKFGNLWNKFSQVLKSGQIQGKNGENHGRKRARPKNLKKIRNGPEIVSSQQKKFQNI